MLPHRRHPVWLWRSVLHLKLDEKESDLGEGEHIQRNWIGVFQLTSAHPWVLTCAAPAASLGEGHLKDSKVRSVSTFKRMEGELVFL